MIRNRLHLTVVPVVALVLGLTWTDEPIAARDGRAAPADDGLTYKLPEAKRMGNLSCASASCHAASGTAGVGGEYTTWVNSDPHFRAYQVLFEPRSRRMVEILHSAKPAHQSELCLSCHAPQAVEPVTDHSLRATLQGVGCEDCHGPAEKYLTEHYRDDFKLLTRSEKAAQYGLLPTKDLAFRIGKCASCHVGDSTREVNHDLIAAGHPRLAFEYTGYHHSKKYSRHWQETAYGKDFDSRAWEIGQIACALAAAELLKSRAQRTANKKAPWPELAEHSCFACHKDLNAKNSWKPLVESKRQPGAMPWGTWYFSTVDLADDSPESLRMQIDQLAALMESPTTSEARIGEAAEKLGERFRKRLIELQRSADDDSLRTTLDGTTLSRRLTAVVRHALTADGERFRNLEWDGATQHYLAAGAHYYAWGAVDSTNRDARLRRPLLDLSGLLAFPRTYNSPKDSDPARILNLFQQLRNDTLDPHGRP